MTSGTEKARRMAIRRANGTRAWSVPVVPRQAHGGEYLIAHACFDCMKSWKMPPMEDGHICPECGKQLCMMGRSFKAPRKSDKDQWEKVRRLWDAGFRFYSYRSFPDAEPLPERLSEVDSFIARNPRHPLRVPLD